MSNEITNIQWFRDATPYINAHRGCTFVIQFGGEAIADPSFDKLVNDISLLHSLGIKIVLVHGARPQIEQRLEQQQIKSKYSAGLRITDLQSLTYVKEAAGLVKIEIEALLSRGLINTPMSGASIRVAAGNYVVAKPYGVHDGIDFCYTGVVRKIDNKAIQALLDANNIVLLTPLGYSATGEVFNLRAEDVASATAVALNADKLIFLTETNHFPSNDKPHAHELHSDDISAYLNNNKTLPENAIRDLQSAQYACTNGVKRVHIIDRARDGALLQELYTRDGIGTLVTSGLYEDLRPASIDDVGGILQLIKPLEEQGILVRRSREQLELEIENFYIAERDGMILGCAALYPYSDEQIGELACLVVHTDYASEGRGSELLKLSEQRAKQIGLKKLFALTTVSLHWFQEHGFQAMPIEDLPLPKRSMYNFQRNAKAFVKSLVD